MEQWKNIEGYEGRYQVSSKGQVRKNDGTYLKQSNIYGYKTVNLHSNGKQKSYRVHRLVAQAFIPNPESKPYIDHINTDKSDNRVENLRWVTPKENMNNPITKENMVSRFRYKRHDKLSLNLLINHHPLIVSIGNDDIYVQDVYMASSMTGEKPNAIVKSCVFDEPIGIYAFHTVDEWLSEWWDNEMDQAS